MNGVRGLVAAVLFCAAGLSEAGSVAKRHNQSDPGLAGLRHRRPSMPKKTGRRRPRRSGPSLFSPILASGVSRLDAYIESYDAQLGLFERAVAPIAAHIAEFFPLYNSGGDWKRRSLGKERQDRVIDENELSTVFSSQAVTEHTGFEPQTDFKKSFHKWLCARLDKSDGGDGCGLDRGDASFHIEASAAGFAVAQQSADWNRDGRIDRTEALAAYTGPLGISGAEVTGDETDGDKTKEVPNVGRRYHHHHHIRHHVASFRHLADAARDGGWVPFHELVGLFDLVERGQDSTGDGSRPLPQLLTTDELTACIYAPLLHSAFHLLDASGPELGDGELELKEVDLLLPTADDENPRGQFWTDLLGLESDVTAGLDHDGNCKLSYEELGQVPPRVAMRCADMLLSKRVAKPDVWKERAERVKDEPMKSFLAALPHAHMETGAFAWDEYAYDAVYHVDNDW